MSLHENLPFWTAKHPNYWRQCVEDEYRLAPLMGWKVKDMPKEATPNAWLFGTNHAEFKSAVGMELIRSDVQPLPQWRRSTTQLGALLEVVPANVRWDDGLGMVHVWIDKPGVPALAQAEAFDQHPSESFALRKALVDLAISYLQHRRGIRAPAAPHVHGVDCFVEGVQVCGMGGPY